ncbi:MAG: acyltransferase [Oligoflexia bacterium]|nr:acyltransferase [Oligoflexia bacterium]
MRRIEGLPIVIFSCIVLALITAAAFVSRLLGTLPLPNDFRGLILGAAFVVAFLALMFPVYRAFLALFPIPIGEIDPQSPEERIWMIYICFWLFFFHPIISPLWLPVPLSRALYRALGCKVGPGSYFAGPILDAHFVTVGSGTLTGTRSLLVPHEQEGLKLAHYPIRLGDRVTVGAGAIVLAGVTVGNDAMIGALSIVAKGTRIGEAEIWAGTPARLIRKRTPEELASAGVTLRSNS